MLGLLGGLATVTDLGTGAPFEESLRRAVVGARLAQVAGCTGAVVSEALYTSLLQHLGCTAYAHETARVWGDDIAFVRLAFLTDVTDRADTWRTWVRGLARATDRSTARVVATAVTTGRTGMTDGPRATCEVARDAAAWLGLPGSVQADLFHGLAMWDGSGHPPVAGDSIPVVTRLMQVASTGVLFALHAGVAEAVDQVRRRAGTYLDPRLADLFVRHVDHLVGDLETLDPYEELVAIEPDPVRRVDDADVETVARAFGSLAELKSPWMQGHSAAVADLAGTAVRLLGMEDQVARVRIAGHLHDVGRVAVSSRTWSRPGPLSTSEREEVRLHPHHSERVLSRVPGLGDVATLVGQHHERSDGSGYHRGLDAARLSMSSRVLAAADEYRSLIEDRPYRTGRTPSEAAAHLRAEVRSGRLDTDAVHAVLGAAGARPVRRVRPAGLTARQVDVLRLVAKGCSNREISEALTISRRTAEHHVQDVYTKIGVSTRAGAALFAMQHGLLDAPA